MYQNTWGSSPSPKPPPANNPFLENSAASRFPALDLPQSSFQSSSSFVSQPLSPSSSQYPQSPYGIRQQPQQQYEQQSWPGQPQFQSATPFNQSGYPSFSGPMQGQQTGFGGFGQQSYGQPSPYGGQQFQQQFQPQFTGYPQFQQQPSIGSPQQYQQNQQNLINEFDPFANSNPSSNSSSTGGNSWNSGSTGGGQTYSTRTGPNGHPHPRAFIQTNKSQLESWNSLTWSQAITTFEELKKAWENRRAELQRHLLAGQYLTSQETDNLKSMIKDAENKIDSVAASLFQMQEIQNGYKVSLDAAGKNRVREAINAGLRDLPDWP